MKTKSRISRQSRLQSQSQSCVTLQADCGAKYFASHVTTARLLVGVAALAALAGCASKPTPPPPVAPVKVPAPQGDSIDYDKLEQALGLSGEREDVGYREKSFGTCDMGYGFNRNRDCRMQYLVVLRFRLQCREHDGVGGQAVDASAIHALETVNVKWLLGRAQGTTQTDADGYGMIRVLAGKSQKRERAKLTVDGKFLILRAEDLSRVVAPTDWCAKYR